VTGVHRSAQRFGAVAREYERARPGYPPAAVAEVVRALGLAPGVIVADVAAGTGKLTRLLVESGATVIAVEPVAGMREQLASSVTGVDVRDGTAEALPFADGELDAITVAQAAHWFAPTAAAELARTLRSGGAIAAVYNVRDRAQRVHDVISIERERIADGAPNRATGRWRLPFDRCPVLEPAGTSSHPWSAPFSHAQVLDQVRSLAPVAAVDDADRQRVLAAVAAALATEPDPVELRYQTEVSVWHQR
jgi:SAM-dependent methyltransferase